jgi:RNA polymerase primary sigma factor
MNPITQDPQDQKNQKDQKSNFEIKMIEAGFEFIDDSCLKNTLPSPSPNPADDCILADEVNAISAVVKSLSPKEQIVLALRYGLEDGYARTFREIALQLGVGPERIRQIEARSLRKLRHPSRLKTLQD